LPVHKLSLCTYTSLLFVTAIAVNCAHYY